MLLKITFSCIVTTSPHWWMKGNEVRISCSDFRSFKHRRLSESLCNHIEQSNRIFSEVTHWDVFFFFSALHLCDIRCGPLQIWVSGSFLRWSYSEHLIQLCFAYLSPCCSLLPWCCITGMLAYGWEHRSVKNKNNYFKWRLLIVTSLIVKWSCFIWFILRFFLQNNE